MSKKEKKQLDKLEAIAIERAEQRVVEGTYLKLSFLTVNKNQTTIQTELFEIWKYEELRQFLVEIAHCVNLISKLLRIVIHSDWQILHNIFLQRC